jgi:hypothetical protein
MEYKERIAFIGKLVLIKRTIMEKYPDVMCGNENALSENLRLLEKIELKIANGHEKKIKAIDLKYYEEYLTLTFQEASGDDVEEFWGMVREQNLPLQRVNKMAKILKRGRIKDQYEYDFVTDVIVPYIQANMITAEEEIALNEMLGKFEMKQK